MSAYVSCICMCHEAAICVRHQATTCRLTMLILLCVCLFVFCVCVFFPLGVASVYRDRGHAERKEKKSDEEGGKEYLIDFLYVCFFLSRRGPYLYVWPLLLASKV